MKGSVFHLIRMVKVALKEMWHPCQNISDSKFQAVPGMLPGL